MSSLRRPESTAIGDYSRVAPFYDRLATIYSLGAIDRSRNVHLAHLAPDSRVFYAGAGTGQEAIAAAQLGHRVELWDPNAAMLRRARARCASLDEATRQRIRLVQAPAQTLPSDQRFDAIVCNYFLNVFAPDEIAGWLTRLAPHLRPNASLWIADFAPLQGPLWPLAWLYHALPMACFRYWTQNANHRPYDYARYLQAGGWDLVRRTPVGLSPLGPHWYCCWQAQPRR